MLRLKDLHVCYGELEVLRGVNLHAEKGEVVVVMGPNGHGKTTLLKTISGLLRPSRGSIEFQGKPIENLTTSEILKLGIVFAQCEQNFPGLTVKENLYLGSYSCWSQREERLKFVKRLFPRLEERENQLVSTLSGGERHMVGIGRGLMAPAKLILLDEPLSGLAPSIAHEFLQQLLKLKELGVSTLFVEQRIEESLDVCDKIYIMGEGQVIEGDKEKIRDADYIARFYFGIKTKLSS